MSQGEFLNLVGAIEARKSNVVISLMQRANETLDQILQSARLTTNPTELRSHQNYPQNGKPEIHMTISRFRDHCDSISQPETINPACCNLIKGLRVDVLDRQVTQLPRSSVVGNMKLTLGWRFHFSTIEVAKTTDAIQNRTPASIRWEVRELYNQPKCPISLAAYIEVQFYIIMATDVFRKRFCSLSLQL